MSPSRRRRLARTVGVVVLLGAVLAFAGAGRGQSGGGVRPLPVLGVADSETALMGSSTSGETWGYRLLPLSVGDVAVGGRHLAFGPAADPARPDRQLVFERYAGGDGWQIYDAPVDESGEPYRGPVPNRLSARITPGGGGVLIGRDTSRPVGAQAVVIVHDPGGDWHAVESPAADVLLPGEALASDAGSGSVGVAPVDEGGSTGIFVAPQDNPVDDAILHFDGDEWTREPVTVPPGSAGDFRIIAVDATGPGNAWALAVPDGSLGASAVLLQRTTSPGGAEWVPRDLGSSPFADRDNGGAGTSGIGPIEGPGQPLTVSTDGVWIDLTGNVSSANLDVTIHYSIAAAAITGSWCDAPVCDGPLGARFSRQAGYRSFAWGGSDAGTRIITNPLDPGGGEDTNRGTYLSFENGQFTRLPGGGGNFRPGGAFTGPTNGWLEGPVRIAAEEPPDPLSEWPISIRAPLTDVTGAPGEAAGSVGSAALAVGADGAVARYAPGVGWQREFLLSSTGGVNKATLRGVAWPEAGHAFAVGDLGAMWQWNADDNLWVADPGAPVDFEGNLMDVAFDPNDPSRGYAVGRQGVLLGYGKSWEQEKLPAGFERADLTSIGFAGSQAIVAAGHDLLVNDGGGWRVDASAKALLDTVRAGDPQLFAVAGLPDGGAVAAGRDIVIERDTANGAWHFTRQPLPGSTVIAAAATRPAQGGPVRAVVSVLPQLAYPPADDLPEPDPTVPPPLIPPFALPGDGYLLGESAGGWTDLSRAAFSGTTLDRPLKSDPALSLLLDPAGSGWVVGGWSGQRDAAGRGTAAANSAGRAIRTRVRTSMIARFGAEQPPPAAGTQAVKMPAGPARFAVAGHAQCEQTCALLAPAGLGPDAMLTAALDTVAGLRSPTGPRALLYTGNRVKTGLTDDDATRYASLLGSNPAVPVFPALGSNDVAAPGGPGAFQSAFASFPAPFGNGAEPAGISTAGIPGAAPGPGARTHFAFDTSGDGGRVRVIVIDNSAGSLAASDPFQNPAEAQLPWLQSVLADARARGIPAVVMGNRSLNPNFSPRLNVAGDASQVAQALLDGGASAYLFDQPEENRALRIPAGSQTTIPAYGVGTLGYRSSLSGVVNADAPDSLFGEGGVLILEVNAAATDAATNRAPVSVRLIPVLSDLSLEATDGTLLRRSRPALFRGLGRRPAAGDRWGNPSPGTGNPDPSGGDPYTNFPADQCLIAGCSTRITPEYTFTSSDPDIADFVRQDPASTNLRKPFIDANDKVVTDSSSGLLCPFNAGTATLTISSGGFSYSQKVTVQGGSVLRPCGTRPLDPSRFKPGQTPSPAAPPPPTSPHPSPSPSPAPPPPPATAPAPTPQSPPPATPPAAKVPPPATPPAATPPPPPFVPLQQSPTPQVPAIVPPPPPPVVRPLPPGGAPARVYQVEEKREEEAAPEESSAFSRRPADGDGLSLPPVLIALVLIAAFAGASARGRPGPRNRVRAAPAMTTAERTRRSW